MRSANLSSAHPIAVCDWHSTFLALAQADGSDSVASRAGDGARGGDAATSLPGVDGINQWPVLSGLSTAPLRREIFVGSGVLVQANYKLIATKNAHGEARWSGPMFPKVPATGNVSLSCSTTSPCLFDVVADYREQHDLADSMPDLVAKLQSRLGTLMEGVFEAPRPPKSTQAKVCAASVANGMWITPYDWPSLPPTPPSPGPKCRPPAPAPGPSPQTPLPRNEWLASAHQWEVNGSSVVARQDCAVLKKACTHSMLLPANETRFFDTGGVVELSTPPKSTPMCGPDAQYYEVRVVSA
jgi:hypothetical protein